MKTMFALLFAAILALPAQAQTIIRPGGAIYDASTGAYIGHINLNTGREERLTATLGSGLTATSVVCVDSAKAFTSTCSSATPSFGATTVTTLNGNTITTGTGVLTIAAAKTLTASNTLTLAGTDSTVMTFPPTSATIARTDAANSFSGIQTFNGSVNGSAQTLSFTCINGGWNNSNDQLTVCGQGAGSGPTITAQNNAASAYAPWNSNASTYNIGISGTNIAFITANGLRAAPVSANQFRMTQTTVPTCSSNCGTSPSIVGSDTAGIVTMGASGVPASGWVVTFNGTWAAAPSCVVQSALTTMVVGKQPIAVQTSTTTITVTTNGTAPATSDKYAFHCIGIS